MAMTCQGENMNLPCFYVTIIVDVVNGTVIAYPKIIESIVTNEVDGRFIVQTSLCNQHLRSVKKDWVFWDKTIAEKYVHNNSELTNACNDARIWLENYLKKKKG